ncbi:MAG: sulfatase [Planctomycetaceae bacterium]
MKTTFVAVSTWGLLAAFSASTAAVAAARAPNVVLILADDLGWADLHCYGGDLHETPNLDRLARQGMRFTNAYAASPVCSPTRASIMTGKHPARLGMTIWHEGARRGPPQDRKLIPPESQANLRLDELTLAEVLHDAGYDTAHVGKWHLGDAEHYPENQGFDINIGGTLWGAPTTYFYPYRGQFGSEREPRYVPRLEGGNEGEYLTDRLTDEALAIIERAADRPFFLNLWYHAPHTPIEAKPEAIARFRNKLQPGMNHQNPVYAAMVGSLDENVGRILAKLDELRLAEDTIVIFSSDNGGYINAWHEQPVTSNAPLRSGKGSLYEGGIRVPLIVRYPGVTAAGAECHEAVCSTDFYPTLLDALKLSGAADSAKGIDGVSLLPLLKDPRMQLDRDTLFFHYPHYYATTTPVGAIRAGRWKLLEYFETDSVELYDLEVDVGETKDLANSMRDRAAELRARLHAWRSTIGARMPSTNPRYGKKK